MTIILSASLLIACSDNGSSNSSDRTISNDSNNTTTIPEDFTIEQDPNNPDTRIVTTPDGGTVVFNCSENTGTTVVNGVEIDVCD